MPKKVRIWEVTYSNRDYHTVSPWVSYKVSANNYKNAVVKANKRLDKLDKKENLEIIKIELIEETN